MSFYGSSPPLSFCTSGNIFPLYFLEIIFTKYRILVDIFFFFQYVEDIAFLFLPCCDLT